MFESLSEKQKEIVFGKSGKFVVRACPGSGKTYCVSARLARLILDWKNDYAGIAAVSFTNVAWQEIEKKYSDEFKLGDRISFPHFLGTIDSFINKYIFLPYGHLILKCKNRPILVGEPHGIWTGKYFNDSFFDNLSYNIDGSIYAVVKDKMPRNWEQNRYIIPSKKKWNKAGYATQSDANYFAMKILETYPSIAKAVALRFPYLIVDEAQDTSAIQMRIIDLLIENGLNEVMLVGDPDQAIFEWNDARPDLLNEKYNSWINSVVLNESRRSSQHICNYTYNISSLAEISTAVSDVKDFAHQPGVILYDNNLPQIVTDFVAECEQNGIIPTEESIAVIYRSKNLVNDITGIPEIPFNGSPWVTQDNYTKDFAKGKFLYDNGDFKSGFKAIEKAILKQVNNLSFCSEENVASMIDKLGFVKFKSLVYQFINLLPKTDIALGQWITAANEALTKNNINFQLSIKNAGKDYSFNQVFLYEKEKIFDRNYRLGTVHSVKGETFDATLLILKTRGVGKAYKTILRDNISIADSEELRIAYVGMTRPRKILVIAVPNQENKTAWENKLN
ncbi:MAG: ATP-dependent helicase [Reichenbachiella sp.]|uniref:ATP-dependent helicase n=1 Tax=Reichenbachiella sp. TaxID=2184521 RepID=UPI0029671918|nr:ATP-dependent helicase [Reichenbachiella sp.]MDW3210873.1 ATP-dependent helicase [Reichenbachiella sp.]